MAQKLIALADGKTVSLLESDDPSVWNYFGGKRDADSLELYSRVAAAFTAVNKVDMAVSNVPFVILQGKKEIDSSAKWENKLGFMPNPRDLLRRIAQSIIMSNAAYARMGKNRAGVPKKLHFVVQPSININTDPITGQLKSLDRVVGARVEKSYQPDDNELIRFWWLDNTTELLPSENTSFKAIMNAAGTLYWADAFTKIFFQNGGIKPTLIAMKGLVSREKEEDLSKGWTRFLRDLRSNVQRFTPKAKIYNAEAMDIKSFGDGLGDLKETPVFRRALEDIAMGMDIPFDVLMSNSANYATAQVSRSTFYRENIVPRFDFIADCFNEQLLVPMGYRMENRAETADTEQEEEVARSTAMREFNSWLNECASEKLALGQAATFGFELTEELIDAIREHFADKEANAAKLQEQTKPIEIKPVDEKPVEQVSSEPKAIYLTLDNTEELRVWREVALRKWRKAESLDFQYEPHYGGLPLDMASQIKSALVKSDSIEAIKAAFDIAPVNKTPEPVYRTDPAELEAIRLLVLGIGAGVQAMKSQPVSQPMTFNLTTQMPEVGAPSISFIPEPAIVNVQVNPTPVTVENQNTVNVEPTPITVSPSPVSVANTVNVPEQPAPIVNVTNDVRPSQVVVKPPTSARVKRNRDGKITGIEAE